MSVYMMATKATIKLGDISSDEPDLCIVFEHDSKNFYGNWITGFGFINVRFPMKTTRQLTVEEAEKFAGQGMVINSTPIAPLPDKDTLLGSGLLKKREDK